MLKLSQIRPLGPPSGLFLCPYDMSSSLVNTFWHRKMFQGLILFFSIPWLWNHCSRDLWLLFGYNMYLETRNWVLGMLIATGESLLWGPFSGHTYKHTYTHVHLYFYPSLYLYLFEISSSYSWFKIKSNGFYVSGCSCLVLFLSPQSMGFPEGLDFLPCA